MREIMSAAIRCFIAWLSPINFIGWVSAQPCQQRSHACGRAMAEQGESRTGGQAARTCLDTLLLVSASRGDGRAAQKEPLETFTARPPLGRLGRRDPKP